MGKTLSDAYVELDEIECARAFARQRTPLKGRIITIRFAKDMEVFRRVFPSWTPGKDDETPGVYLKREEINAILLVCKHYKVKSPTYSFIINPAVVSWN